MSEEIKAWDEAWAEEFGNTNEGRKASAEFKEILRGIERSEGGKAAFEFLLAGGHLGFSKDMWGSEEGDYYKNLVDKITEQSASSSICAGGHSGTAGRAVWARRRRCGCGGRGGDGDNKRDQ